MPGIKGFVNNSSAITWSFTKETSNFRNLKSQCYFFLADRVAKGEVAIYSGINMTYKELLIEDLEQIKQKDPDKDAKLAVIGKDEIKENIGRSPDFSDALMMRMLPELTKSKGAIVF